MVWFQCEDCGDNLKKPKLPNHFRACSASKLSCIDCGEVFGQASVESHTQCITEQEKYGPKGQVKATNGTNTKPKNDTKQKPEIDINVGLSERPPWFCSLCNTKATSKQTLLLHADGKKHRAKARAHHFANKKPNDTPEANISSANETEKNVAEAKDSGEQRDKKLSEVTVNNGSGVENNDPKSNKKRKLNASEKGYSQANGGSAYVDGAKPDVMKESKKAKHSAFQEEVKPDSTPVEDSGMKKIKWKKHITLALKSNPKGQLKFKELKKLVLQSLKESGYTADKNKVYEMLQEKVNSSSRFVVEGKYLSLATTS